MCAPLISKPENNSASRDTQAQQQIMTDPPRLRTASLRFAAGAKQRGRRLMERLAVGEWPAGQDSA